MQQGYVGPRISSAYFSNMLWKSTRSSPHPLVDQSITDFTEATTSILLVALDQGVSENEDGIKQTSGPRSHRKTTQLQITKAETNHPKHTQ